MSEENEVNGNGKRKREEAEFNTGNKNHKASSEEGDLNEGNAEAGASAEAKGTTEAPSLDPPGGSESIATGSKEEASEDATENQQPSATGTTGAANPIPPESTAQSGIVIDRTGSENPTGGESNPAGGSAAGLENPKQEVAAAAGVAPEGIVPSEDSPKKLATDPTGGLPPGFGAGNAAAGNPDAQQVVSNPEQMVEERGEVAAMYVGRVIGKGGEMIRDLQARSGARIDVDQNVPQGQPRVITYRGTRKTVDFAKRLVHLLCQEGVNEADLPLGEARREVLIIPSSTVGKVIGRGGEMIRELQSRSQAKIQVDHSGGGNIPPDQKQVTITGTDHSVVKAKEMVMFLVSNPAMDAMQSLNMLVDEKLRSGGQWGSGPPYANLPNQGAGIQPYMVAPQQAGPYGGGYQDPQQGGYGAAGAMATNPYGQPQQQQQTSYGQYGAPGAQEVDVTYAKKQFMGRVIGQKGATINDLQRRSGCDIQINQEVAAGQDCEITIRGTRQGVDMAKQMIREIIEIGPNHPYAGGDQSGGYGGGGAGGGGYQQQGYDYSQQAYGYQQRQGYGYFPPAAYGQQPAAAYGQYQQPPQQQQQQYGVGYGQPQQQQYGGAYAQQYQASATAPPPPPAAAPAAGSWKTAHSPDGQVYYYNDRTGETTWEKPAGMP